MPFENGELWSPLDPDKRGLHPTFGNAIEAAFGDMFTVKNEFFDNLVDNWNLLFPGLPARPGRYDDGKIFIYVKSAPMMFMVRPRLREIAGRLSKLPGAPKKVDLRLEIHAS